MRKKMKVCTKCNEDKPLSEYGKMSAAPDGLKYHCKSCVKATKKAYREANREKIAARNKAYHEANRDEIAARKKAYYQENRENRLVWQKAYYQENRDEIIAEKKEYHAEKWANDPEYRAQYTARNIRRSRLLASAVQEPYLREDIFERDNWTCQLCQEPIDQNLQYPESGSASIDHILPVSHGGDDTPDNVQAAHLGCNIGKGNRVELEDQAMLAKVAG